jgi:Uma2 family endonuclease
MQCRRAGSRKLTSPGVRLYDVYMATLTVELPSQESLTEQNLRRWAEVISDPKLTRLEERVETDRFGHIIMSPPPSAHHGSYQFKIGALLDQCMRKGRVVTECPLSTADGVRAADVAWASPERVRELGDSSCFPRAPEICVEVLSPGNTAAEIRDKTALYFDAGALEVWHCTDNGKILFFHSGQAQSLNHSQICSDFPVQVIL